MLIISNVKDYYDYCISYYGIDKDVVYDRREYSDVKNSGFFKQTEYYGFDSYRTNVNKTEPKEDLQNKTKNNKHNNDKDSSINGSYYNTNSNNNNSNNNESSSSSYQGSGSGEINSSMEQSFNLLDHDKQGKKQSLLYLQYRPNMNPSSTNTGQILPLINKK